MDPNWLPHEGISWMENGHSFCLPASWDLGSLGGQKSTLGQFQWQENQQELMFITLLWNMPVNRLHDPQGTLNKKLTPHCFRHFLTTHLRRAGMPGNSSRSSEGTAGRMQLIFYDHIDPEELRLAYLRYIPKLLWFCPSGEHLQDLPGEQKSKGKMQCFPIMNQY